MTGHPSSTKERIIDAAIELFADKGYPETSMRDIAAIVGIKSPSIYNHFASKEEILDTILEEYITYSNKNTLSPKDIAGMIEDVSPEELIEKLFFSFSKDDAPRYTKIYKVVTHEQFREPKATAFVRDYLLIECQRNIKDALDQLVAAKKIRSIGTGIYAKLLISLTLAAGLEMTFYEFEGYQNIDRVPNRVARHFLIDQIVTEVK